LITLKLQLFGQAKNIRVGDIDPIKESKQIENDQEWYYAEIDLSDELALSGMRRTEDVEIVVVDSFWRSVRLGIMVKCRRYSLCAGPSSV